MKYYLSVFKNYTVFSGRARRAEYWNFYLFNIIFLLIAMALDYAFGLAKIGSYPGVGPIYIIYTISIIIPSLAVLVRRLHDVGKSGWMFFISLIPIVGSIWLLVLLCTNSDEGDNEYGPNPKNPINPIVPIATEEESPAMLH